MSKERVMDRRQGKYEITPTELLERLPEGLAQIVIKKGIPTHGTGHYSIPNELARVHEERRDK